MEAHDYLAAIRREGAALAAAVRAHPDSPVPSCPEWRVRELANHVGTVHRWAAENVAAAEPQRRDFDPAWALPSGEADAGRWYEACLDRLCSVLENADPDAPAWTFSPADRTNRFWYRRQAVETAVHRWDAESAAGDPSPIEADLAADGVDEFLEAMLPRSRKASAVEAGGETVHFHRTDGDGEWLVTFEAGGHGVQVERAHGKGAVAARGPASDLLLFLWHRVPPSRFEVFGDATLLDRWFELVPPI